jgi:3',5'-nucleoside bisphosphate phosphatase
VAVLAVTDHDTVDGVAAAREAGERLGVRVLAGVELSARVPAGSMHVVGLFPGDPPESLVAALAALRAAREERARRILERLAELGAPVAFADVRARAAGPIGRPHVADALVAAGHAADRGDAFARFLGDGGPAAVPHRGPGPEAVVRLVADAGGAAVLAHPRSLGLAPAELDALLGELRAAGLRGVEVHRPDHAAAERDLYGALARRHGLVAGGGSDFHGPGDPEPGDTGHPPLPPGCVARLIGARVAAAAP